MKGRCTMLGIFAAVASAMLTLAGTSWAAVILNSSPISIPDSGQATPYPATINVSGLSGTITDVDVTLGGVSHTWPDDVSALLVGPGGQNVMLMSDVGGGADLNGVELTFDDEAPGTLPDGAQITAGTYKPTQVSAEDDHPSPASLPSPAPAGPYGASLSALDGAAPNGTYSLYVYDDATGDAGQLASGFSLDIKTTADPPTDVLPDLRMARLQNLQIQSTSDGRKLLRFDSIIVNVGAGRFEAGGSRSSTSAPMTVTQRIFNGQGGYRDLPTTAQMYFAGDGHTHWHLRDLERYELIRLDNGKKVGTGAKHGFCFYENYRFGSTRAAYYKGCGNNPDALEVRTGLSRGWGDIYQSSLPDQYIDITGLTSGRYRLQATADADNWFLEHDDSNNFTWVNIQISGDTVSVKRYGPSARPISG
jgi:subtilisin-like proprotein convertase family protein